MKRVFAVLIVLAMSFAVMGTAFAAETEFVPSIGYKPAPEIIAVEIVDEEGNVIEEVPLEHLLITSVSESADSEEIPPEAKEMLLYVYEQLTTGAMTLPAEKLSDKLSPEELTVRDLFDLSWICPEEAPTHEDRVEPEGARLRVTFDLNLAADARLFTMTYKDGEWNPIVSVTNNGDGTVTCVFEHLCPVAFIYGEDLDVPSTGFQFNSEMMLWLSVMVVSSVGLVAVVALHRKKEQA